MKKPEIAVVQDVLRLNREVMLHRGKGTLAEAEIKSLSKRLNYFTDEYMVHGEAILPRERQWLISTYMDLSQRRMLHEAKEKLLSELNKFLVKKGTTHEEAERLRTDLRAFTDATAAKRWLGRVINDGAREAAQVAHAEFLARLKPATNEPQTPTADEHADMTDTERRVQLLEQAASKSSCWRARKYYRDGLAATDNREKLRLFKLSVREDERKRRSNT
jgi:hypothetical protein